MKKTDDLISELNWLGSIVAAAYLISVFYNGNIERFFQELKTETPFLEFVASAVVVYYLYKNENTSKIVTPFIVMAMLGLGLKLVTKTNANEALKDFGAGKAGLFETVGKIVSS
jgi:hypothetical protein